MTNWVMTSRREAGGIHFYIGRVRVASVLYNRREKGGVNLVCPGIDGSPLFESVSDAMKEMHRLLSSPKEEDNRNAS